MVARVFKPEDFIPLKNIHEQYFDKQFELPSIVDYNNLLVFTIPDENDKPIVVGVIKQILELITVTDQSLHPMIRHDALLAALGMTAVAGQRNGYDQIHAFVSDPKWAAIMKKRVGFATCKGEALYLNI